MLPTGNTPSSLLNSFEVAFVGINVHSHKEVKALGLFYFLLPSGGPTKALPGITTMTYETSRFCNSLLEEGPELYNSLSLVGLSQFNCLLSNYKKNR